MNQDKAVASLVEQATGRLSHHPSYKIDLGESFTFTFNGRPYPAYRGDTIASALWAANQKMLSRSFKYHRPRGLFALTAADTNTLVRVNDEPNVRASVRQVEPGMEVRSQNTWPSLKADIMSLNSLGSDFLPVGFYYKTFIRPKALWPTYEKILRNAAGLGYVTTDTPNAYYDKKYMFADVLVVGGGPAGMNAALAAADAGAQVLLLDENPYLGGHLAYERNEIENQSSGRLPAYVLADQLAQRILDHPRIGVALKTMAFGIYQHLWVGAV